MLTERNPRQDDGSGWSRRQRRRPLTLRFWWVLPVVVLVAVAAPRIWLWIHPAPQVRQPLPGYISDSEELRKEYRRFQGRALEDAEVEVSFQQGRERMLNGEYSATVILLETTVRKAALPVVFNDLGVVYAKLDDGSRALNAFRDALARDIDYQPVRSNLKLLKFFDAADPVTREMEPNNSNRLANVIAVGKPVDGEISAGLNDVDCYRFNSPPAPRDLVAIELANHSQTLEPRVRLYDAGGRLVDWSQESPTPGASLRQTINPASNTTLYIHVEGAAASAGAYTLTVSALKAFDSHEPNDLIVNATKIALGEAMEANIMDGADTDFYSFVSSAAVTVNIDIHNRSTTLIPAVATYTPDMRNSGFGPDIRSPGENLHHTMKLEANQGYYIQVWGQANTDGAYTLTIK